MGAQGIKLLASILQGWHPESRGPLELMALAPKLSPQPLSSFSFNAARDGLAFLLGLQTAHCKCTGHNEWTCWFLTGFQAFRGMLPHVRWGHLWRHSFLGGWARGQRFLANWTSSSMCRLCPAEDSLGDPSGHLGDHVVSERESTGR